MLTEEELSKAKDDFHEFLFTFKPSEKDIREFYNKMQELYHKNDEKPFLPVSEPMAIKRVTAAVTNYVTPHVNLNFFDVTDMKNFNNILCKDFKGDFRKWNPKDVNNLIGFGYALEKPVDFYNLAKKMVEGKRRVRPVKRVFVPVGLYDDGSVETTQTDRYTEISPALKAMPAMGINDVTSLKNYVSTYELAEKLKNKEPVSYDELYNKLGSIKKFMLKSPMITYNIIQAMSDEKFAKKWGRKLIKCK